MVRRPPGAIVEAPGGAVSADSGAALEPAERVAGVMYERVGVRQPGERVVHRQPRDLGLGAAALGDVLDVHDRVAGPAGVVASN